MEDILADTPALFVESIEVVAAMGRVRSSSVSSP